MPHTALIREGIFGIEDGMVSTLGSLTGIAAAVRDPFTILLAGFVIISVESISMGVGSYISSKSEKEIKERKLSEEKQELKDFPIEEKEELINMYVVDGWSKHLAKEMAEEAAKNKHLFLKEMAYRELKVFPDELESPQKNGLIMGSAYIIGGMIPLTPYLLFPLSTAIVISISATLLGLFVVGALTTKYSKQRWWKAGLEMLLLAGLAALIGYIVGQVVDNFLLRRR